MGKAKVCICGHNVTDHKVSSAKNPGRVCLWDWCGCPNYTYDKMRSPNYSAEPLPTLIDASKSYRNYSGGKSYRKTIVLQECNSEGINNDGVK